MRKPAYGVDELRRCLEDYGVQMTPSPTAPHSWQVTQCRGRIVSPPVLIGLAGDEVVAQFVDAFARDRHSSGDPLELAMMSFVEGIDSLDPEEHSAFTAVYLTQQPHQKVEQVFQRRDPSAVLSHFGDADLEWRSEPGRS